MQRLFRVAHAVRALFSGNGAVQGCLHRQAEGPGERLTHPAKGQEYHAPLHRQGDAFPGGTRLLLCEIPDIK